MNDAFLPRIALASGRMFAVALATMACASCSSQPEEFEKIPFTQIYATVPQKGMKRVVLADELPFDQDRLERFRKLRPQASNLFLTNAEGLRGVDGVAFAAISFRGHRELVLPKSPESRQTWLVIFFGFARPEPARWTVTSVEIGKSQLLVNFTEPSAQARTEKDVDAVPYFVLVPMRDLKEGTYILELRKFPTKLLSFQRTVKVSLAPN